MMKSNDEEPNDFIAEEPEVYIEDGFIILRLLSKAPRKHEVELSRCKSNDEILSWVLDLSRKNWVTRDSIAKFIELAQAHHGIKRLSVCNSSIISE